ncbi:MAG: hypothetical protein Q8J85_00570 [Sulfuricurvum sp.]|nr:hypothetical protein [Sulfuricurvum sp.]MDP3022674.1 hypothetical protein [Sulfuricurvum sp.]
MIKISATLLNVYTSNDFTNKETGEIIKGKNKLQLLLETPLKNGGSRKELMDLSIPFEKVKLYKGKENEVVEVDVATIGKAIFYGI